MTDLDKKYNIIDEETPINASLSAKFKRSFAFYTIQERLPIILTKVIDQITRDKDEIGNLYENEVTKEDVKEVVANISQLKYELQTNKELVPLTSNETDKKTWNDFIERLGDDRTYFSTKWLYAECYMYRRLKSIFEQTRTLKEYDYFQKQKDAALLNSLSAIDLVLQHVHDFDDTTENGMEEFFGKVLRLNLWGNRCDLSISNGREVQQSGNPFTAIGSFEDCLLVDRTKDIWNCIRECGNNPTSIIDVVLDNAGYELFTDFVMADFLLRHNLIGEIRFHCKSIPWFISDVLKRDFYWTIDALKSNENNNINEFGKRLHYHVQQNKLQLCEDEWFWTSPYEFQALETIEPTLYELLSESQLVIFKGDLNYRKLLADVHWPFDTTFEVVVGPFRPSNICALRTIKADCVCEVAYDKANELSQIDKMWMETGQYGLIQFVKKP